GTVLKNPPLPLSPFRSCLPPETCSNDMVGMDGINENGAVCCTFECGQCGGEGCGSVPGLDNTHCCINGVLNNQELCSVAGAAPCVIDSGDGVAAPTPVAATTPAPVGVAPTPEPVAPTPEPTAAGGGGTVDAGGATPAPT
ncbi:unnamed protein product, partial [Ectocarpus sp. 8 AP-2014]